MVPATDHACTTMTSSSSTPRRKLLVIDDEPTMCELIGEIARHAGYDVQTTTDAATLQSFHVPELSIIVLDLSMPDRDGIEVLRELAALGTRAGIVLISGFDARVLETAHRLGEAEGLNMVGHLAKPLRVPELMALLKRCLPGLEERASPVTRAPARPQLSAQALREGMARGQLVMHYQPQVRLSDGAVTGIEALVRWQHPDHGLLYPDAFIRMAESEGLALELTEAVLQATLHDCAECFRQGMALPTVSINLPPEALTEVSFPDRVMQRLAELRIPARHIAFELTETSLSGEPITALDILTRLRLKGIHLAIDDFGVGYSSMEQLQKLPFTELKIDRQFVQGLGSSASADAIVRRTIGLGHDLHLKVLAEGIETLEQWRALQALGCDLGQGYLIARPLPRPALAAWLAGWIPPALG